MKKKLMIFIVLASLPILTFAACQKTDDKPKTGTPGETGQTESGGTEEPPELMEFVPADAGFGGYNFRLMGIEPFDSAWVGTQVSEIYSEAQTGELINDAVYMRNQTVEELYNISISLVPLDGNRPENGNVARRAIMSGDDMFDAALMAAVAIPTLLAQAVNMMEDMNRIPEIDFSKSWWNQNAVSELSVANKLFIATGDITLFSSMASACLHMNQKLTQDFALDNPYELVRAGKWTWDKVYDMNKKVTRDLDGDGQMTRHDQWGMFWEDRNIRTTLLHSGERITKKDADDMPYLAVSHDFSANIVQAMIDTIFSREVSIDCTNSPLLTGTDNHSTYWLPKFLAGEVLFSFAHFILGLNLRVMESDFAILPPPKFDENQDRYYTSTHPWWATYLWVPTTNPDLARTGTILEALGYYSRQYVTPAFIDTFTYKVARDEDSAEMMELIIDSQTHDIAYMYNWGDIFGIYDNSVLKWENRFASGFEAREGAVRADMEKTINAILGME